MKRFLLLFFIIAGFTVQGQVYNNEWIDYNKTYYKFKVGVTGLYRISLNELSTMGISSAPAEHFQLWRNGKEIPIYTTSASGPINTGGYLEFWGERNDGKPDTKIYQVPDYQLSDKISLQTDTAAFFLTINPAGGNLRLAETVNDVAGNILPKEEYFMHKEGNYFRNKIHAGHAVNVGEFLYSSAYDKGEGWSSADLRHNTFINYTNSNLFVYTGGPDATISYAAAGNAFYPRKVGVRINNVVIDTMQEMNFMTYAKASFPVPISVISTNSAAISFDDITAFTSDRMVIARSELTYPRLFNFGGSRNFIFKLPANALGNYLEISNFNFGGQAPVLYDLTNRKRYVADITAAPLIKIVLEPSSTERELVLLNQTATNILPITGGFIMRNFIDYGNSSNQGDYLIITNSKLRQGQGGSDPVEEYRQYRSSAMGGGYNAKIYDEEELTDQFAFGIKKHPIAIRNFVLYTRANYTAAPKFVFLIGKGVTYNQYRTGESNPDMEKLNLVPTFGNPASDNLFTSNPGSSQPQIPIGRIGAISTGEVTAYFNKVKEYEQNQAFSSPIIDDKDWMKNVVHIIGASEGGLQGILETYMAKYKKIIEDTLFGANVYTFSKTSADAVEQLNTVQIAKLFEEGMSMITYFGHSSATTLEFNLDKPEAYNNNGKYPLFFALGCNVGNFYNFSSLRLQQQETLSEKFVLTPNKGSIAFIASSHFGIVHYLDIYNTRNYHNLTRNFYHETLGENLLETIRDIYDLTTEGDFYSRVHSEELILHGDPAIRLNTHAKPDYAIEEPMVKINPTFVSIAETNFKVDASFINLGKAIDKSIVIEIKRQYPDQTIDIIRRDTIPGIRYMDSISVTVPIDPVKDKGLNKITVTIDADFEVDELYETNNSITKDVFIYEDDIRPVYPYNFAIINNQNIKLAASTANALSESKQYLLEIDTTALFNSSFKKTQSKTSGGGVLEFEPGFTFTNNTVYYWRVAIATTSGTPNWHMASFIYLPDSEPGFNQSHFFQHTKSTLENLNLDSTTRNLNYGLITQNLFIRNTVYPFGGTQESEFTVSVNGDPYMRSACVGSSLIFHVFDEKTFRPWKNVDDNGSNLFLYGSGSANCQPGRQNNIEFSYTTSARRKIIMDFIDSIPEGAFVVVRSIDAPVNTSYSATWRADTSLFGSNNSLYHKLLNVGFANIDDLNARKSWILVYQKGVNDFQAQSRISEGLYDKVVVDVDLQTPANSGNIISPSFGPAKAWKELQWAGQNILNAEGDEPLVSIIGRDYNGLESVLVNDLNINQQDYDISFIDATQYPFIKLVMKNTDTANFTPYQLEFWRLTYDPVPEGAIAPNYMFQMKDSLEVGELLNFKVAFKNVSQTPFDSI
nr:hypothetical protein [Chitinophagaceae bacterium]